MKKEKRSFNKEFKLMAVELSPLRKGKKPLIPKLSDS